MNLLAKRSVENRGGIDDSVRGRDEEAGAESKAVLTGNGSDVKQPSTAGRVMASIPGRVSANECRSFRSNSEDTFVNPFAGPWNDEAVLAQFKQDLAANPERFEDLLAAYVKQDPGLAPRLLSLALARRPMAAIRLASVVAATGALGHMRVLSLFVAAAVTKLLGPSDQADAADSRSDHVAQTKNFGVPGLMEASVAAAFLLGGKELMPSGETSLGNRTDPASLHAGGAGSDDGSHNVQLSLSLTANSHTGPVGSSHIDQAASGGNIAVSGPGQLPANLSGDHGTANGGNLGQDTVQGPTANAGQPNSEEGTINSRHGAVADLHSTHSLNLANGSNTEPDTLSAQSDNRQSGVGGAPHGKAGDGGTQVFGNAHANIDGSGPGGTAGSDVHGLSGSGDPGFGFDKGAGNPHGGDADGFSSFLGPHGMSPSTPTILSDYSNSGGTGYEPASGWGKATAIGHDFGLGTTSSSLAQSDYGFGIQPVSFVDAHDPVAGGATAGSFGQGLAGLDLSHNPADASFLSSPSTGGSLASGAIMSAANDFGASLGSSVANLVDQALFQPLSLSHDATVFSGLGASSGGGTSLDAAATTQSGVNLPLDPMSSFIQGVVDGATGLGTNGTSTAPLGAASTTATGVNLPLEPVTSFIQNVVDGATGLGASGTSIAPLGTAPSVTTGTNLSTDAATGFVQGVINGAGLGASGTSMLQPTITSQVTTPFQPMSTAQGLTNSAPSTGTVTGPAIGSSAADTHNSTQSGVTTAAQTGQASVWMTSGVAHNLADAFSWQGTAGGDGHGSAQSTLTDWAHIGSGHSV